jgi:hypothetical protein
MGVEAVDSTKMGIQHAAVSTAGWLFNPEELFGQLETVNNRRVQEGRPLVRIEIYPTIRPRSLERVAEVTGMMPPTVDADYIYECRRRFGSVEIANVHLEFNFSRREEIIRTTIGENILPPLPEGSIVDRFIMGVKQRAYQANWMVTMGVAERRRGVEMAQAIYSGISAHPNVIEGFAQKGELEEIKKSVPHVYAENERPYKHSPHLGRLRSMGISDEAAISDPRIIERHFVEEYNLDGLVYGADHGLQVGRDIVEEYSEVSMSVRMIHIAGSNRTDVHTLTGDDNNTLLNNLLKTAATSEHEDDLTVVLDLNPLLIRKMSREDQLEAIASFAYRIDNLGSALDILKK